MLGFVINLSSDSVLRLLQIFSLIMAVIALWIFSFRDFA